MVYRVYEPGIIRGSCCITKEQLGLTKIYFTQRYLYHHDRLFDEPLVAPFHQSNVTWRAR